MIAGRRGHRSPDAGRARALFVRPGSSCGSTTTRTARSRAFRYFAGLSGRLRRLGLHSSSIRLVPPYRPKGGRSLIAAWSCWCWRPITSFPSPTIAWASALQRFLSTGAFPNWGGCSRRLSGRIPRQSGSKSPRAPCRPQSERNLCRRLPGLSSLFPRFEAQLVPGSLRPLTPLYGGRRRRPRSPAWAREALAKGAPRVALVTVTAGRKGRRSASAMRSWGAGRRFVSVAHRMAGCHSCVHILDGCAASGGARRLARRAVHSARRAARAY